MSRQKIPDITHAWPSLEATSFSVVASDARLRIEVQRAPEAARFAPEGVWFEAIAEGFGLEPPPPGSTIYRPEFHEIEYDWEFGEPGATFIAPQNVPAPFRDANTARGQIAAHVFQTGGSKRVRCVARRVIDAETMEIEEATAEVVLEIGDPGALWTASNTVVVAQDEDFTGAPPGARATTVVSSDKTPWWSNPGHWLTQVNRLIGDGERSIRVLFKRGEAYPTWLFKPNTRAPHIAKFIFFGAWGDPRKFKPAFPRLGSNRKGWANGQPVVFHGLQAAHDYDPITETGSTETLLEHNEGGYALFSGVDLRRAGAGALILLGPLNPNAPQATHFFHDCAFEDLAGYGLYCSERHGDRIAYLGCRDVDPGSAPHGGDGNRSNGNAQGPMRLACNGDWVIASNDFFSRFGWSGQGNWPDTEISASAEQPSMRLFSGGAHAENGNGKVIVSRCAGEGGLLLTNGSLYTNRAPAGNLVVDQVIQISSASSYVFLISQVGATTVRNGLWIKPAIEGGFGLANTLNFNIADRAEDIPNDRDAIAAEPIRIHNNTFIIEKAPFQTRNPFGGIEAFRHFDDANNVFFLQGFPDHPRHEDIAPFEKKKLYDLRWLGRLEYQDNGIVQRQFAAADDAASLYIPQPGSPLVGTAIGMVSVVDLLGRPRSGPPSRGALEPEPH